MTQTDYKSAVLEVYPDAVCEYVYYPEFDEYGYQVVSFRETLSWACVGDIYAWEQAYEDIQNLKNDKI